MDELSQGNDAALKNDKPQPKKDKYKKKEEKKAQIVTR